MKKLARLVFVATLSTLVALIVSEVVLRVQGMADPVLYLRDSRYGYEPRPDQSTRRLGITLHINDIGLRDDENRSAFQDRKVVLIVGNSVTYGGSRTDQEDLFTEILEDSLQTLAPTTKVANAGVNGHSVAQMTSRAERLVSLLDPELIVFYTIAADFRRPPVQYLVDGNYPYPTRKPRSALVDFARLSGLYLDRRYGILEHFPEAVRNFWEIPENVVPPYDASNLLEFHLSSLSRFLERSWQAVGRRANTLLLFLAPGQTALCSERSTEDIRLVERMEGVGVPFVDLFADFDSVFAGDCMRVKDYYWDEVHYRERGHRLAAAVLFRYLACHPQVRGWASPEPVTGPPRSAWKPGQRNSRTTMQRSRACNRKPWKAAMPQSDGRVLSGPTGDP